MKLKDGFVVRKIGESTFAVAVGERSREFSGMVKLSESGELLWELLSRGADEEALIGAIVAEYEIDDATARADVKAFCDKLSEAGLFE